MKLFDKDERTRQLYSIRAAEVWDNGLRAAFSIFVLFIIVTLVIPLDVYTTALWYDNIGMQIVASSTMVNINFFNWVMLEGASLEAVGFAFVIWASQVLFFYKAQEAGRWSREVDDTVELLSVWVKSWFSRGKLRLNDFNWEKAGWYISVIVIITIDVLTDIEYRTFFRTGGVVLWGQVFMISFIYYNMFSEWAFTVLGKWSFEYSLITFRLLVEKAKDTANGKSTRNSNNSQQKNSKNKPNSGKPNRDNHPNQRPGPALPIPNMGSGRPGLREVSDSIEEEIARRLRENG